MIGRSLNADLRKMKGTSVILAHLLIPIITSVIFLIYYFFSPWNENMKVIAFYQAIGAGLPVLIGIFTASVMEQEQNAGNFQNLLSLPDKLTAFLSKLLMLLVLCLCSILLTAIIFGIGFGRIASSDIDIMKGCIFAALLLWGSGVPLYLWQLILAFQFGKGVSIGAGIMSGLISVLMLTGLGDYVWKYVFVCWTGRVPYTYLQSVLGETSVGEWLSFIPCCLIFTGISMVYYFWWVNHWEGNRISE